MYCTCSFIFGSGQLGVGKDNFQSLPAGVVGFDTPQLIKAFHGERILKVACGAFHSACVSENGNVYTWGKEDYGMLGIGFTGDAHQPQLVHFFKDFPARYKAFMYRVLIFMRL